jgi:hypothetical protein
LAHVDLKIDKVGMFIIKSCLIIIFKQLYFINNKMKNCFRMIIIELNLIVEILI